MTPLPKQYVDDSIDRIKFPVTVTELYDSNINRTITFSSSNYDVQLLTLDDDSYLEADFLIIKYKVNSCSFTFGSSGAASFSCLIGNFQIIAEYQAAERPQQSFTIIPNNITSSMIFYHSVPLLNSAQIRYPQFTLFGKTSNPLSKNSNISLTFNRSGNSISGASINIDIKILLAKFI